MAGEEKEEGMSADAFQGFVDKQLLEEHQEILKLLKEINQKLDLLLKK